MDRDTISRNERVCRYTFALYLILISLWIIGNIT